MIIDLRQHRRVSRFHIVKSILEVAILDRHIARQLVQDPEPPRIELRLVRRYKPVIEDPEEHRKNTHKQVKDRQPPGKQDRFGIETHTVNLRRIAGRVNP